MYSGVPTTVPARVSVWSSVRWVALRRHMPKSRSFTSGKLRRSRRTMKTFSGFMSRWTMPSAWAASRPGEHLHRELDRLVRVEPAHAARVRPEGLAVEALHHEEGAAVLEGAGVGDRAHVGVVDRGGHPGLALEAGRGRTVHACRRSGS